MLKSGYTKWLEEWFADKTDMPAESNDVNFFNSAWLDSFKTLSLVLDIEKKLGVSLSDSAMSDARFSTITGLSEILFEQKNASVG